MTTKPDLISIRGIQLIFGVNEQSTCLERHTSLLLMPPKHRFEDFVKKGSWMINRKRLTDRLLGRYLEIGANGLGR